ncbi:MAG: AAA family ATPase [Bacteroidales bacterium]|nr:AAA family ATPase [Bacteroidales bacterium]
MKIVLGHPARRQQFYKRENVRMELIEKINIGSNLLISAPRRFGKSSILLDLIDDPVDDFYAVFIDSEHIDDGEVFYKELLKEMLNTDAIEVYGRFKHQTKTFFKEWSNRISGIEIAGSGVTINSRKEKSNYNLFKDFIRKYKFDKKIVIIVDEFPETIKKIIQKSGKEDATLFLSQNRSVRQNHRLADKVSFIYTGSIGLQSVVNNLCSPEKINDLEEIKIKPLKKDETINLAGLLLTEKSLKLPEGLQDHFIKKIDLLIPFHVQLMVKELADICFGKAVVQKDDIDKAFEGIIKNGNIYFESYKSRLNESFSNTERFFIQKLLLRIKEKDKLHFAEISNLASECKVENKFESVLETLLYDGYLVADEPKGYYSFYSIILKSWWK